MQKFPWQISVTHDSTTPDHQPGPCYLKLIPSKLMSAYIHYETPACKCICFLHQITIISHNHWLFSSNPTDSEQAGMHVNEYVGRSGLTKQWAALGSQLCSPRLCTAETSTGQRWTAYVRLHVGNSSSGCRLISASANHQHLCAAYYGLLWSPSITAQFKCGNWITCGFYQGGNHALSVKKNLTWALDSKACTWLGSKVTTCWLGV